MKQKYPQKRPLGSQRSGKRLGRNMRQVTVYLHVDQLEALQEYKDHTMVPMSALIRHGIDLALKWAKERQDELDG